MKLPMTEKMTEAELQDINAQIRIFIEGLCAQYHTYKKISVEFAVVESVEMGAWHTDEERENGYE